MRHILDDSVWNLASLLQDEPGNAGGRLLPARGRNRRFLSRRARNLASLLQDQPGGAGGQLHMVHRCRHIGDTGIKYDYRFRHIGGTVINYAYRYRHLGGTEIQI